MEIKLILFSQSTWSKLVETNMSFMNYMQCNVGELCWHDRGNYSVWIYVCSKYKAAKGLISQLPFVWMASLCISHLSIGTHDSNGKVPHKDNVTPSSVGDNLLPQNIHSLLFRALSFRWVPCQQVKDYLYQPALWLDVAYD